MHLPRSSPCPDCGVPHLVSSLPLHARSCASRVARQLHECPFCRGGWRAGEYLRHVGSCSARPLRYDGPAPSLPRGAVPPRRAVAATLAVDSREVVDDLLRAPCASCGRSFAVARLAAHGPGCAARSRRASLRRPQTSPVALLQGVGVAAGGAVAGAVGGAEGGAVGAVGGAASTAAPAAAAPWRVAHAELAASLRALRRGPSGGALSLGGNERGASPVLFGSAPIAGRTVVSLRPFTAAATTRDGALDGALNSTLDGVPVRPRTSPWGGLSFSGGGRTGATSLGGGVRARAGGTRDAMPPPPSSPGHPPLLQPLAVSLEPRHPRSSPLAAAQWAPRASPPATPASDCSKEWGRAALQPSPLLFLGSAPSPMSFRGSAPSPMSFRGSAPLLIPPWGAVAEEQRHSPRAMPRTPPAAAAGGRRGSWSATPRSVGAYTPPAACRVFGGEEVGGAAALARSSNTPSPGNPLARPTTTPVSVRIRGW